MTDTVTPTEMGIGDDELKAELEQHAEQIAAVDHAVVDTEVKNEILDGVAHMEVQFSATLTEIPDNLQNYIIAEGLHMFAPKWDDGNKLSVRLTTGEIYETWGGMDTPDLPEP